MIKPGDPCQHCGRGVMGVYCSRIVRSNRIRYLSCRNCSHKPERNIQIVPMKFSQKKLSARTTDSTS